MEDVFSKKNRERIEEAKKRTRSYEEKLSPDQSKRLDRIVALELLQEGISHEQKRELKTLKKQQTKEERKYWKAIKKEVALYS